jgi:peroxiredoxin
MKHLMIALLIPLLFNVAQGQKKLNSNQEFVLKGKVIGQKNGFLHLSYFNSQDIYQHDSCLLKSGSFEFKGSINEPTVAFFYGNIKSRAVDDPNSSDIYLEPTKMVAILKVNDFKEGQITGSQTQNEFANYNRQYKNLEVKWDTVFNELKEARLKNDTEKINNIYDVQLPKFRKENDSLTFHFIKKFPGSYVSINLLGYQTQRITIDSLKYFYALLTTTIQQSKKGISIQEFIKKAESLYIGKKAPNFSLKDIDGNDVSLNDFKGKYVFLDFWASYCIPCRNEHPYLKQAFSKYQNKGFTIIEISLDKLEDKNQWMDAIKKDSLSWTQLCDFKALYSDIVNQYDLRGKGIPSSFLINPNGEIIAKDLRGFDLEEKLAELIK